MSLRTHREHYRRTSRTRTKVDFSVTLKGGLFIGVGPPRKEVEGPDQVLGEEMQVCLQCPGCGLPWPEASVADTDDPRGQVSSTDRKAGPAWLPQIAACPL